MKRIISVLLAVCILFSLSASALALNVIQLDATMSASADETTVNPGDTVTVTLSLNKQITAVTSLSYKLYFDTDLFTLTSSSKVNTAWDIFKQRTDANGTFVRTSVMDTNSEGLTLEGAAITLTFTAQTVTEAKTATFTLVSEGGTNYDNDNIDTYISDPFTVTVTPAGGGENPDPTEGYEVTVSGPAAKVSVDEDVEVTLAVNKAYAPYEIQVSYDSDKLTYKSVSTTDATAYDNAGTLHLTYANADSADTTDDIVLTFTAKAEGSAEVSVTSAAFESVENSTTNLSTAAIKNSPVTIEIGKKIHTVTLPDIFDGASTVADGADYTFTGKDPEHYDYSNVKATVDGQGVEVTDNGNGSYTVKNVTGDLTITGKQTGKKYTVTVTGSGKNSVQYAETAKYGENYYFDVELADGYTFTTTVTIGGESYQPELDTDWEGVYSYTISGEAITGNIVINVEKTQDLPETTTISFTGSGSGDVKGGTSQTATNGQDFTFEIDKKTGYTYTVKLGDETLTPGADGKYTIPGAKINGTALTVTVEKTAGIDITVSQYLKLDEKAMFLVTATSEALTDGQVLNYGENAMYWSNNYNAYAYLVISNKSLDEVKAEAKAKVAIQTGTKTTVEKTADVNGSGKLDANDAQMVYNMYNVKYEQFGEVTMVMFLRADQNTDREITTQDAVAVINAIVAAKKG